MLTHITLILIPFCFFLVCAVASDPDHVLVDPHLIRWEDIIYHIKNDGTWVPANEFFSEGPEGWFWVSDWDNIPSTPTADFHMAYEFLREAHNNGAFPEELQKMAAFKNAEGGKNDLITVPTWWVVEATIVWKTIKTHLYMNRFALSFWGVGLFLLEVSYILAGTSKEQVLIQVVKDASINLGKLFLFFFTCSFWKVRLSQKSFLFIIYVLWKRLLLDRD